MRAPNRTANVGRITDGRYAGEAFWIQLDAVDADYVNDGRRNMPLDRASALELQRKLARELRRR